MSEPRDSLARETDADARDDPIGYFLEDMQYHGKAKRTRDAYARVLRSFEAFLSNAGAQPVDAGRRDCLTWVHHLREQYAESTVATYASYVNRFYSYMQQVGVVDGNPMALVSQEMDEAIDTNPTRRDISVAAMREFIADITHPLERAVIVGLLKTGLRVGELCNLDLRDVNLDAPAVSSAYEVGTRGQLGSHPDTLYVDPAMSRGETVNGEQRSASNKRKRATLVPLDRELKTELVRWLAIRPDTTSPADPVFVSTQDAWGKRLTPEMVRGMVRRHAEPRGWYHKGGDAAENVTPHYFRHFFTTHLRNRTGDRGVVKYLRGDVADDIIDTYTHNWGDRVREVYLNHIYSLTTTHGGV
ncbi:MULTISPECIES: tyrosine-type recombinase/integrase [Halobacterium]|uniref:tyrosine-type recombinase/integrase n=1 Tax=Halobacterium TaxID=2239 RepID=UPI0019634E11|nr:MULTISPECIES: tyrosine-type recombinase/integrase [Halobacterium]MCF2166346.1 tyrosine-type recombinase/integrase [Halobacterium salinarum]MCF2168147.1 tyrosine-type recombinase/integrase [Halobacterium salinarum]MCF2237800.1 tyrosine-type recombinase/integrase [Halobacterium salinarum]QRY23334.1 tyrosine-type recombinase/integrase [Halobacterium sp. GSL-19]